MFDLPLEHRRRLQTNNALECLNREIKRRMRVATLFPYEASLLRLATAVQMETDEEWQSDKRYVPQVTPSTAYEPRPLLQSERCTIPQSVAMIPRHGRLDSCSSFFAI